MQVRLFCHNEPHLSNSRFSEDDLAYQHASEFLKDFQTGKNQEGTLVISTMELNDRAQVHCEKWVEDIGTHFSLYASAKVPSLIAPGTALGFDEVMKTKSLSGDVSGTIGEALFSLLLTNKFGLTNDAFAHLRADAQSGIYPDFAIYTHTSQLQARLEWDAKVKISSHPTPAEVKTISYPDKSEIKGRIRKAIGQIRNYWTHLSQNVPAPCIICVAIRNQNLKSYELGIIWGL